MCCKRRFSGPRIPGIPKSSLWKLGIVYIIFKNILILCIYNLWIKMRKTLSWKSINKQLNKLILPIVLFSDQYRYNETLTSHMPSCIYLQRVKRPLWSISSEFMLRSLDFDLNGHSCSFRCWTDPQIRARNCERRIKTKEMVLRGQGNSFFHFCKTYSDVLVANPSCSTSQEKISLHFFRLGQSSFRQMAFTAWTKKKRN